MEHAKTRKDALRIESALLNKIAAKGVSTIANAIGVNASQITRWKDSLIPRMSMILAVLEYGIEDEEMAELTKRLANYLTNEKPQTSGNSFRA